MRVLAVEDNLRFVNVLRERLNKEGFIVDVASTAQDFRELSKVQQHAMYLIDIGLPDGDGLTLVRELRTARRSTPVLILSARSHIEDRVAGLNAGADDYLGKPFHFSELLARMRALLRRPVEMEPTCLKTGMLVLNCATNEVFCDGRRIDLRPSELRLLVLFIRRSGRVVSKESIENTLQSGRGEVSLNAVDKLVSRLRKALEVQASGLELKTVRGMGYVLEERV
jgi:two-component system, OmpR family, response regulator